MGSHLAHTVGTTVVTNCESVQPKTSTKTEEQEAVENFKTEEQESVINSKIEKEVAGDNLSSIFNSAVLSINSRYPKQTNTFRRPTDYYLDVKRFLHCFSEVRKPSELLQCKTDRSIDESKCETFWKEMCKTAVQFSSCSLTMYPSSQSSDFKIGCKFQYLPLEFDICRLTVDIMRPLLASINTFEDDHPEHLYCGVKILNFQTVMAFCGTDWFAKKNGSLCQPKFTVM